MRFRKNKIVISIIAISLAIVLGLSLWLGNMQAVEAATRMYGVQQIVDQMSEEDPFVVLEMVPDEGDASLGYYVSGSEPGIAGKLLQECQNKAERYNAVRTYLSNIASSTGSNAYPAYYNVNNVYQEQVGTPEDAENWQILIFDGVQTEVRNGSYVEVGPGADYIATVVEDTESTESTDTEEETTTDTIEDETTEEETSTEEEISTEEEVQYVYTYAPGEGTYAWVEDNSAEDAYEVSFEKLYYKVNVKSNDWFSKYVLEKNSSENIEVISITPKQLEANISEGYLVECSTGKLTEWNSIDLLYLSNSSCLKYSEDDLEKLTAYKHYDDTQASLTREELINAGMITEDTILNDISWETAYNIYEHVMNTNMAVIVDESIFRDRAADLTNDEKELLSKENNLLRLAFLLKDYTTNTTPETYQVTDTAGVTTTIDLTNWSDDLGEAVLASVTKKDFSENGSVQGSVYVLGTGNLVNKELNQIFYEIVLDQLLEQENFDETELTGIAAVVKEIDNDNFYNEIHEADYTKEYNVESGQIEIAQSTIVKYVLNYAYRRASVYKDTITVLDIEPTKYSTLTEETIRGWLKEADSARIKQINIVQTSTSEFIGTLVDLNEEYDLIYIGSCIGPEKADGAMYQKNGETIYNDTAMNGLIYSHIGDSCTVQTKFGGLLKSERVNGDFNNKITGNVETRFSGNDITKEKMNDLKAYAEAGYPVVISEKLYSGGVVKTKYVDNSSYLYEFMNDVLQNKNVMNDKLKESSLLATYLNMSKLYLSMVTVPTEYKVTYQDNNANLIESVDYLQQVNGKYSLDYTFELTDNSEAKIDSIAYEVQLFIDTNADGRYDTTEELDGLQVRNLETGEYVNCNQLETGVRYTVTRQLPDGYVGMIPWKLLVSQVPQGEDTNSVSTVHDSAVGYTAVPTDEVTTVRVLQITSDKTERNLDLTTNAKFKALFQNVKDIMNYDIQIKTVSVAQYLKAYNNYSYTGSTEKEKYTSFYNSYFQTNGEPYDMLILGFTDMYDDITSEGATMAIKMFIESGRSVLFSHDTTSFVNASEKTYSDTDYWGYFLNQYIRSIVGMDRYGITEDSLSFLKDDVSKKLLNLNEDMDLTNDVTTDTYLSAIEAVNKDVAYNYGTSRETANNKVHGYSNGILTQLGNIANVQTNVYYTKGTGDGASRVTSITQTNKGQITSYPFDLNIEDTNESNRTAYDQSYQTQTYGKLNVATTHSQYYQLDMQLDKTADGDSDIVVWYCLGDGMYDAIPNDVRNNYYIYSVGNVMYTGMGHFTSQQSISDLTWDEAKLFVNTIIASYNSGKKDPTISIVESAENKGTILQYAYRTFDKEMNVVDNEDQTIYFYVNDNNIINGTKQIAVKYYVETNTSAVSAATFSAGDSTTNLIEIGSDNATGAAIVDSNVVYTLTLDADWINSILGDEEEGKLTIYIGAQTTLDYDYERPNETTSEVFASITIKRREMFNLD